MKKSILWQRSSVSIVALTLALVVAVGTAQQAPPVGPDPLPDGPQVLTHAGQRFRVVPLKGFVQPWALAFLPNGDSLITELSGSLRIVRKGVLDPKPISGIPQVNTVARKGLMDLALHPRFAENRLVYFTYSKTMPGQTSAATATLARGRFDGGSALTEVRDLFVSDAYYDGSSQSKILFGPDGKLFMAIGIPGRRKVGNASDAQDGKNHSGKILRLNDDGTAPKDNPFVGKPGYRPEIYALGIRNALGMTIHPTTGELWETENGPQGGDEINIIKPGKNYGWPVISFGRAYSGEQFYDPGNGPEGSGYESGAPTLPEPCAPGMEQPFLAWLPAIGLSNLVFYTGDKFPAWKGNLFIGALGGNSGDYKQLVRVIFNNRGLPVDRRAMLRELSERIRDVKQGPDGLLYLLVSDQPPYGGHGALLRIEPVQ
jgi:aldose sugar dehydrogenase